MNFIVQCIPLKETLDPELLFDQTTTERCIKQSLHKSIIDVVWRDQFIDRVQQLVFHVSKCAVRGSLVFNRFLLFHLRVLQNEPFPDLNCDTLYFHCFAPPKKLFVHEALQHVHEELFSQYPITARISGDSNAIVSAARRYKTNFKNSLWMNFESRQKKVIRQFLDYKKIDKSLLWPILFFIKAGILAEKFRDDVEMVKKLENPVIQDLIQKHRKILVGGDHNNLIINESFLKHTDHIECLVRYNYHLMEMLEEIKGNEEEKNEKECFVKNNFTLAPIHHILRQNVTLDAKVMFYMLKDCNWQPPPDLKTETLFRQNVLQLLYPNCLRLPRCTNGFIFTGTIETDGITASFHFRKKISVSVSVCDEPKKKKFKAKHQQHQNRSRPIPATAPATIIGIDPGRVNLITAVERTSGSDSFHVHKLTAKQHYSRSGMTRRKKRAEKWNQENQDELDLLSKNSFKTINVTKWDDSLNVFLQVHEARFKNMFHKRWAREDFRVYRLKTRSMDIFFRDLVKKRNVILAYGNASFASNGPGTLFSAPTNSLVKRATLHAPVEMIDEFRTSILCHVCHEPMQQAIHSCPLPLNQKKSHPHFLRDLKRCCSTVCLGKLRNRDVNAAINILTCFEYNIHGKHFEKFSRDREIQKLDSVYIKSETTPQRKKSMHDENKCIWKTPLKKVLCSPTF